MAAKDKTDVTPARGISNNIQAMPTLQSLPEMDGKQKCYLGPKLMDSLGIGLGDCISLSSDSCQFICRAWPRQDRAEGYIQFDDSVIGDVCPKCMQCPVSKRTRDELKALTKLKHQKLEHVTVRVIFATYTHIDISYANSDSLSLHHYISAILRNMFLQKCCLVKCCKMKLGKLYEIAYIIVNKLEPNVQCGLFTKETKISVTQCTSKERFDQKHFQKRHFDIGGLRKETAILNETLQLLFMPTKLKHKLNFAKGILLRGPSGSGKTTLVKKVASEIDAFLLSINGAEIYGGRPGEGEERLRRLFQKASQMSNEGPCILLIDELDALCPEKGMCVIETTQHFQCFGSQ